MFDVSPSYGAYTADPMSISDIDAHPDRDIIWATISAMRSEAEAKISDHESVWSSELGEAEEDAAERERDDCLSDTRSWLKSVLDGWDSGTHEVDWLTDKIATADDAL